MQLTAGQARSPLQFRPCSRLTKPAPIALPTLAVDQKGLSPTAASAPHRHRFVPHNVVRSRRSTVPSTSDDDMSIAAVRTRCTSQRSILQPEQSGPTASSPDQTDHQCPLESKSSARSQASVPILIIVGLNCRAPNRVATSDTQRSPRRTNSTPPTRSTREHRVRALHAADSTDGVFGTHSVSTTTTGLTKASPANARALRPLSSPIPDQGEIIRLGIRRRLRLGGILNEWHHAT